MQGKPAADEIKLSPALSFHADRLYFSLMHPEGSHNNADHTNKHGFGYSLQEL